MSVYATRGVSATSQVAALTLVLLTVGQMLRAEECSVRDSVALTLRLTSNATGHPVLNGRLEQPVEWRSLQLAVTMGRSTCGFAGAQRTVMSLELAGGGAERSRAPEGYQPLEEPRKRVVFRRATRALPWLEARDACAADAGAELALPSSASEAKAMLRAFNDSVADATRTDLVWVGASDISQEGRFVSVQGLSLADNGYEQWLDGQPADPQRTENCLAIWVNNALLEDVPCHFHLGYFCKILL